jgi:hypothetical protein
LLRKAIVPPLSPQKVQWEWAPHQHPRAVSTSRRGVTSRLLRLAARPAKKSSKSGTGRSSSAVTISWRPVTTTSPPRRWTMPPTSSRSRPAARASTTAGKETSASPLQATSTKGNCLASSSPISPSQLAPPNTVTMPGWAALIRRARARDAMFCSKVDVKPTMSTSDQSIAAMQ